MTAIALTPAVQACAFVAGCAAIHAARAHAARLTRWLVAVATALALVLVTLASAAGGPPSDGDLFDEITVYAALAGPPNGAR